MSSFLQLLIVCFGWVCGLNVVPRPRRVQRNKRKRPAIFQVVDPTFDFTTPNVTATFASPVVLTRGLIPQWLTDTGKLPTSATQLSATQIRCVYDTPGSVTEITVPQQDPAVRSTTGGFVSPGTFPAA